MVRHAATVQANELYRTAITAMDDLLSLIQWPAMALSVGAAWLVAAQSKRKRAIGFWTFLLSNAAWIAWGLHDGAVALIVLQLCLAALNIRGVFKNETDPTN